MIKVKVIEDENGQYVDSSGKHYNIIACSWVKGPRADEFKEFNSLEEAMKAYGLEEYHEPVTEVLEEQGEVE